MLENIADEIVAYRGLSCTRRIFQYLKTPDQIKDMEKELDSALKLFQVCFPVQYCLMTIEAYSLMQLDFSIITMLDIAKLLDEVNERLRADGTHMFFLVSFKTNV